MTGFGWLVIVAAVLLVGWLVYRLNKSDGSTSYSPKEDVPASPVIAEAVTAPAKKPAKNAAAKKTAAKKQAK